MEDEGIGLALAKAVDLRIKISNRINKASGNSTYPSIHRSSVENGEGAKDGNGDAKSDLKDGRLWSEHEEDDHETEILLHIMDAIEALENQLSHLQDLQQQQLYEREVARAEIEQSRQTLCRHLKDYKGEDLQVIREASSFVSDALERDQDLMLPPYRRIPRPFLAESHFLSRFPSAKKPHLNGVVADNTNGSSTDKMQGRRGGWMGRILGAIAKTIITVAGVVTVLNMSGYGPMMAKNVASVKALGFLQQNGAAKREIAECPPGRTLIVENGEARCVVKERVAVPFDSGMINPDVNYGCG